MAEVSVASQEIAQPVVEALRKAFLLDPLSIRTEVRTPDGRNAARDIVIWYEVSILTQGEMRRLLEITDSTRAAVSVIPDDKNRMKVELSLSGRAGR